MKALVFRLEKGSPRATLLQEVPMAKAHIPADLKPWIEAKHRFRLSQAHVLMARELGLNPRKLGKLANHDQQLWKLPLPQFIEKLYAKRFGKTRPDSVRSFEDIAAARREKKQARKERKAAARAADAGRPEQEWCVPADVEDNDIPF